MTQPKVCKWTEYVDIDKELSNEFWANPSVTDKQNHASLHSAQEPTWVMLGNKCSSVAKDIPLLRVPYAIQTN